MAGRPTTYLWRGPLSLSTRTGTSNSPRSRRPQPLFQQALRCLSSTPIACAAAAQHPPPDPSLSSDPHQQHHSSRSHTGRDPSRLASFGFETVTEAEKQRRVAGVFTNVAESYDLMNDLMSFGWHRVWKDHFVASLNPGFRAPSPSSQRLNNEPRNQAAPHSEQQRQQRQQHILDVAGGTGDIAFRMLHTAHVVNANPDVVVTISDINRAMLAVGKQRSERLPASQQAALRFVEANAEDLSSVVPLTFAGSSSVSSPSSAATTPPSPPSSSPIPSPSTIDPPPPANNPCTEAIASNSVDLYTVAFGIRNFGDMPAALREAYRVLRPGGVFACLEFSSPRAGGHPWLDALYRRWSFGAIPLIGQLAAADRDSYQYLVESIARFPPQAQFRDMVVAAGFDVAGRGWEGLTGGVVAVHKGMKPLLG